MTTDALFWAKVDKSGECWIWMGYKNPKGYGELGRRGRKFYAHRYALLLAGIDPSEAVDHICHNPSCVNLDHLRPATSKQNNENRRGANRNSTSGIRGVSWCRTNKRWRAFVGHNRTKQFRMFATRDEAEAWVVAKRLELFTHNDVDRNAA